MSKLTFEDMIRAETKTHVCRIWRAWKNYNDTEITNKELKGIAMSEMIKIVDKPETGVATAVMRIAYSDGVSAVEIIDRKTGDGICVYKDWP